MRTSKTAVCWAGVATMATMFGAEQLEPRASASPGGAANPAAPAALEWITVPPGLWERESEYALVTPPGFDENTEYPVLIAIPPGKQDRAMAESALDLYWRNEAARRRWVVVSPVSANGQFDATGEELIHRVLHDVALRVRVAEGKFYLAGVSSGGVTALRVAAADPARIRAVVVAPGYLAPEDAGLAPKLRGLGVSLFVGERDETWKLRAEKTRDELASAGAEVTLTAVRGDEHVLKSVRPAALFDVMEQSRSAASAESTEGEGPTSLAPWARARRSALASATLDRLHELASRGGGATDGGPYFDMYASDAVFLGTDPTERWTVEEFRRYAAPAFSQGKGWTYHPFHRRLWVDHAGQTAIFDEALNNAKYGRCRGTGTLIWTGEDWKIQQYSLSVPIWNADLERVAKDLRRRKAS